MEFSTVDRDMIAFAWCAYGLVALLFASETYVEGARAQARWDLWRVGGLFLSLLWPAYAIAVLVTAVWAGRATLRSTTGAE
ncbi:hypothetical protein FVA81_01475 (plasmid) [Rhizobium sp. WL3]|uniref:hypothetical protein n=1 Tax=Rhizobium sp. WL3 TaxID=2603277 RepID=UPI0011C1D639|nr:hypothetical protein [Rhizobium sp. WL3]QEE43345.1 hypothetical protein FVA81_01475 [Rhizobium sp. WL3]